MRAVLAIGLVTAGLGCIGPCADECDRTTFVPHCGPEGPRRCTYDPVSGATRVTGNRCAGTESCQVLDGTPQCLLDPPEVCSVENAHRCRDGALDWCSDLGGTTAYWRQGRICGSSCLQVGNDAGCDAVDEPCPGDGAGRCVDGAPQHCMRLLGPDPDTLRWTLGSRCATDEVCAADTSATCAVAPATPCTRDDVPRCVDGRLQYCRATSAAGGVWVWSTRGCP